MAGASDIEEGVLELLRRKPRQAELVSLLVATMRRQNVEAMLFERALAELQGQSAVLVREHYCADPHLEKADLRVAAILEDNGTEDPTAAASERIEVVWQRWLSEYLSNHTCV